MQQIINKKADIEFDTVLKLLIGLIVLLIIVGLIFLFKDKLIAILEKIKEILRFGP